VDLAFGLDLIEADIDSIRLRFINADGYYLYKDGFAFGQPLLLDWYADWCISCKVIEREILEVPSVREQLADYRLVRFDMTRSDAEQRALLDRYQLFGPPALQLFAPSGDEWQDLRTVGETDAESFLERLRQADDRM